MKDIQWSFISLLTASLSHLLLRILLGRELGPSGLGLYTLVFTIYMFGMQFAAFGIGAALTKYVAEFSDDINKVKEYISAGFFSSIVSGSLIGIVLFLFSGIISLNVFRLPEMVELLKITAVCFPFIAIYKAATGTLNGFRNMKSYAFLDISLNASVLLVSLILVFLLKLCTFGAVLGFVIPTIFFGIFSVIFLRSNIIFSKTLFKNDIFKSILNFGVYVVLGNSIAYLYSHIDSLMIGYYLSETEVGFYAVAAIFIQGVTLIPGAIQKISNPMISKNYGLKNYTNMIVFIKKVVSKVFLLSLCISLFFVVFGKLLICKLFGNDYLPAYVPLMILLIGYTVHSSYYSISTFFSSIGKVRLSFKIAVISALLNLILNILLIPKYGIIGAASATTISLITMTILKFGLIRLFIKRGWVF
ncbi:O-antigen/teichoic acid export membrane protein [Methanococcus maripaludis]|uniref:O-antigen/teichoic acid export membrane protein n=2 Tax=Methanococcus maripaludis TaxID=39152 RepID=A0A7J9PTQ5_METMI|nr:O-antigen/teichoic acid export membrane protein [Methanococcus maripaludis]